MALTEVNDESEPVFDGSLLSNSRVFWHWLWAVAMTDIRHSTAITPNRIEPLLSFAMRTNVSNLRSTSRPYLVSYMRWTPAFVWPAKSEASASLRWMSIPPGLAAYTHALCWCLNIVRPQRTYNRAGCMFRCLVKFNTWSLYVLVTMYLWYSPLLCSTSKRMGFLWLSLK